MDERFERPLLGGPNGQRVTGLEVEWDPETKRQLIERLDELERCQIVSPAWWAFRRG